MRSQRLSGRQSERLCTRLEIRRARRGQAGKTCCARARERGEKRWDAQRGRCSSQGRQPRWSRWGQRWRPMTKSRQSSRTRLARARNATTDASLEALHTPTHTYLLDVASSDQVGDVIGPGHSTTVVKGKAVSNGLGWRVLERA